MGGCFCKNSGQWGVVKKCGPFLNAWCIMYSIGIFIFHFTYLGGGCIRTQRTPCLRACKCSFSNRDLPRIHATADFYSQKSTDVVIEMQSEQCRTISPLFVCVRTMKFEQMTSDIICGILVHPGSISQVQKIKS